MRKVSKSKARHLFKIGFKQYKRKKNTLSINVRNEIKQTLESLQESILHKDQEGLQTHGQKLAQLLKTHLKKSFSESLRDFVFGVGFALLIAILIRQMWFELYEIPSGSMRPTLQEKDSLLVSKTTFGINIPFTTKHFYFNPEDVKRYGIAIFTGRGMDIPNSNTLYFYLFPGKKQYIKRLIGKPGDRLYFYGGKIYGMDASKQDITKKLQQPAFDYIDHIPFIYLDGKPKTNPNRNGLSNTVTFLQMNQPVAKLMINSYNSLVGKVVAKENPKVHHYEDLWGFKNFGVTRILTRKEATELSPYPIPETEKANYFLEINHDPNLNNAKIGRDYLNRIVPMMGSYQSLIPLSETYLKRIANHLYTSRFVIKKGVVFAYGMSEHSSFAPYYPKLPGVPDGTYEYANGIAYKVFLRGTLQELPKEHPLNQFHPEHLQLFFNLGIKFDTRFSPSSKFTFLYPQRYAFFRNQDLYIMGAKIFDHDEKPLQDFVQKEKMRAENSPSYRPYLPFIDHGSPLKEDGTLDFSFIETYGLKIPEGQYLMLGDNYANSGDSRDFGFVPQGNLRGTPTFIFWPLGPRFGLPKQPYYAILTIQNGIIWLLILISVGFWIYCYHKYHKLPRKIDS